MIVRQFLQWLRNASPGERAEATSALARAYLHSDLSNDDLSAAEGAMIMLLDDPSPLVRSALAQVFASAQKAPRWSFMRWRPISPRWRSRCCRARRCSATRISSICSQRRSRIRKSRSHRARCCRRRSLPPLPRSVARKACLALLDNPDASIALFSLDRIIERFGHLAAIRENLIGRHDLPMASRQALLAKLSQTLAGFVTARHWLGSSTPNTPPVRPAKRRPSRSRRRRLTTRSPN